MVSERVAKKKWHGIVVFSYRIKLQNTLTQKPQKQKGLGSVVDFHTFLCFAQSNTIPPTITLIW